MEDPSHPRTPPHHDIENQILQFSPHSPANSEASNISKETKRASTKLTVWLGYARFIMQVIISIILLVFCIVQLTIKLTVATEDKVVYFSTISLIFAAWMPSPKIPTDNPNSK